MKVYRVKDKRLNKYLAGGTLLSFTKDGKFWFKKGHLKNTLMSIHKDDLRRNTENFRSNINNWVIEEYDIILSETIDILDFVTDDNPQLQYKILSSSNK